MFWGQTPLSPLTQTGEMRLSMKETSIEEDTHLLTRARLSLSPVESGEATRSIRIYEGERVIAVVQDVGSSTTMVLWAIVFASIVVGASLGTIVGRMSLSSDYDRMAVERAGDHSAHTLPITAEAGPDLSRAHNTGYVMNGDVQVSEQSSIMPRSHGMRGTNPG